MLNSLAVGSQVCGFPDFQLLEGLLCFALPIHALTSASGHHIHYSLWTHGYYTKTLTSANAPLSPVSQSHAQSDLHANQIHLMLINTSSFTQPFYCWGHWLKNLPAPSFLASWMHSLKGLMRRRITCLRLRKQPFDVQWRFQEAKGHLLLAATRPCSLFRLYLA